jgi:Putative MetA-pathway of phenol degradation
MRGQLLAMICVLFAFAAPARAQLRPLVTEEVDPIKPGSVRFEFGFDFLQDKDFTLSGLNGDLSRLGVTTVRVGLAPNVEFQAGGVIRNALSINGQFQPSAVPLRLSSGTNSTHDVGDFYLAAKIKLRAEGRRAPSVGFRFGVQLPTSNQERGIGLNQTNFFAAALFGKRFGRWHVFGNLGLGILTAPVDPFAQNDVLLYGAAVTYEVNPRLTLAGEVNGRANMRGSAPLGTESDGEARLGARIRAAGLVWDVAGIAGLNRHSARSGLTFGVSYAADLFAPAK